MGDGNKITSSNLQFVSPVEKGGNGKGVVSLVEKRDDSTIEKGGTNIWEDISANTDVLIEFFSRVPLQILFTCRCVSKGLCNLTREADLAVRHHKNFKPLAERAITGLIFQEKDVSAHPKHRKLYGTGYIPIEPEAGGLPDPELQFLKQKGQGDVVDIIDSCNGLLLCCNTTSRSNVETCFVCNPLTKEKFALPYPKKPTNVVSVCYALMADLESNYITYKVLCLNRPKSSVKRYTELSIFSSDTGKWIMALGDKLPPIRPDIVRGSRVFFNGILYWDCLEGHILVCRLNAMKTESCYKLIEAPRATLGRYLWKSEDKLHCYCYCDTSDDEADEADEDDEDKMQEWTLSMDREFTWNLEDDEDVRGLIRAVLWPRFKIVSFEIISYEPQSKTILLFIPNCIYKYSFKQRTLNYLKRADPHSDNDLYFRSRVFPYMHSLLPIQTWSEADGEPQPITKMKVEGRRKQRIPRLY